MRSKRRALILGLGIKGGFARDLRINCWLR